MVLLLDDKISMPFKAKCIFKRAILLLTAGEEVEVLGMTSEDVNTKCL
jgi:hypothetical protein